MSIAPSQQSFLINSLTPLTQKPKTRLAISTISCRHLQDDHNDSCRTKSENQLAKLAIVTLAAGVLTLGSVGDASAAKSGGRVGGQAFRSSAPRSSPRINNNSRCTAAMAGILSLNFCVRATRTVITSAAGPLSLTLTT
ncbi:hypothetical protein P3X46_022555 [Hevea brasiliensis]|uniref:Uncharacterized protein n=1 Tax=Hevea brasiliensis TaxID=3981 RepID=A0ABQ9LA17_HEVBR|nr:hypothetical protein P3X46_022555 [Hevea brasiliensis]